MTLAPDQSISGRFELPDGSSGYVVFTRRAPEIAGPESPFPGSTVWRGDDKVRIAFPDDPPGLPGEGPLGFASWWLADRSVCRVVVRNVDTQPATFRWTVVSAGDAFIDWDLSGPEPGR